MQQVGLTYFDILQAAGAALHFKIYTYSICIYNLPTYYCSISKALYKYVKGLRMITHKEHRRIGIATLCTQPHSLSESPSLHSKPSRSCADVDKSIKYLSMQGEPSAVVVLVVQHIIYVGKKIQLLTTTYCILTITNILQLNVLTESECYSI